MKIKNIITYILIFFIGSMVSYLLMHLRFYNDYMRRELLLFMAERNTGYFLAFVSMDFYIIMGLLIWLLIIKRKERKSASVQIANHSHQTKPGSESNPGMALPKSSNVGIGFNPAGDISLNLKTTEDKQND